MNFGGSLELKEISFNKHVDEPGRVRWKLDKGFADKHKGRRGPSSSEQHRHPPRPPINAPTLA